MVSVDELDRKILASLQNDARKKNSELASEVGLSAAPCWRRVQRLDKSGVIRKRVALVDAKSVGLGLTVFVSLKTREHTKAWLDKFAVRVRQLPEVQEAYRMSGEIDYLLRVVVADVADYDRFYKELVQIGDLADVSSAIAMEEIKYTTALPL